MELNRIVYPRSNENIFSIKDVKSDELLLIDILKNKKETMDKFIDKFSNSLTHQIIEEWDELPQQFPCLYLKHSSS
jgi:chromosomal replication initiation ATPase DnaA